MTDLSIMDWCEPDKTWTD